MTIEPTTTPLSDAPVTIPTVPHDHTWRLRSIEHSDGTTVREFGCDGCSAVWFD